MTGNGKTQEAKNKVICNHKQFPVWSVLLGPLCVSLQPSFHSYVIKIIQLCSMLFYTSWVLAISKSPSYMRILITKIWYSLLPSQGVSLENARQPIYQHRSERAFSLRRYSSLVIKLLKLSFKIIQLPLICPASALWKMYSPVHLTTLQMLQDWSRILPTSYLLQVKESCKIITIK